MKKDFFDYIIELMRENKDIYFISCGLGWPRTNDLAEKYPDWFIQTEAAEQTACDIAVGLSYEGKIPVIYTITPFYYRAFETLRTYFNHEKLHVCMIGAGRDSDYSSADGFSHEAGDITEILGTLKNIKQYYPYSVEEMQRFMNKMVENNEPSFISIPK